MIKLLIITIFIGIFLTIAFVLINPYYKPTVNQPLTQPGTGIEWNLPDLPEGYDWVEVTPDEDENNSSVMFYDNRYAEYNDPSESISGRIEVTGKLYQTTIPEEHPMYEVTDEDFYRAYEQRLNDIGWLQGYRLGEYQIQGMAADGFNGSRYGYVKREGYYVRTIVFAQSLAGNLNFDPESGTSLECPCSKNLSIYVSDEVDLRDIIPQSNF